MGKIKLDPKRNWDNMSPVERKAYINQDYVPHNKDEISMEPNTIEELNDTQTSAFCGIEISDSNHLKELIIALHQDGKSLREIAYHLPCSFQYASLVINSVK